MTERSQKFCFINVSSENFLQETLFCSFHLLYTLLVRKNFDSSDISCPFSLIMVMESTSLRTS